MLRLYRVLLLLIVLVPSAVQAHPAGITATDLFIGSQRVELVYTVPADDLWRIVGGEKPAEPLPAARYAERVQEGFLLSVADERCTVRSRTSEFLTDIGSYEYRFRYECPRPLASIRLDYSLFVGFDRAHRNLTRIYIEDRRRDLVLAGDSTSVTVPVASLLSQWGIDLSPLPDKPEADPQPPPVMTFFKLGIEHILLGYDHVLFLLGLLLVSLRIGATAILVTTFTLSHSVTLALATLGIVTVPGWLAETVIALSVAWVGVANTGMVLRWPRGGRPGMESAPELRLRLLAQRSHRWLLVGAFGLVHGLGFAGMLTEIGLPQDAKIAALALFNLGVEVGQLAIVLIVVPILAMLARRRFYPHTVLAGSAFLVVAGTIWALQRAFL